MSDPCSVCGADRALVGRVHNCRPRLRPDCVVEADEVIPALSTKKSRAPSAPGEARERARAVLDAAVSAAAVRQRRWREKNRDRYNATMRTYRAAKRKG